MLKSDDVDVRNDPATEYDDIRRVTIRQLVDHLWEEGVVCTRKRRKTNCIDIFLNCSLRYLRWCLMQTRIDHLEPGVAEGTSNDFGAAIVSVETGFGDEDSSGHDRRGRLVDRKSLE